MIMSNQISYYQKTKDCLRRWILGANRHAGISIFIVGAMLRLLFKTPYPIIYQGILIYAAVISVAAYFVSPDRHIKWWAPLIGAIIVCIPILLWQHFSN